MASSKGYAIFAGFASGISVANFYAALRDVLDYAVVRAVAVREELARNYDNIETVVENVNVTMAHLDPSFPTGICASAGAVAAGVAIYCALRSINLVRRSVKG